MSNPYPKSGVPDRSERGRKNYEKGYSFEDRVAESYRLLGYAVQHGRIFSGRQIDLFLELDLGDFRIRRAVECKAGEVTSDDLDKFLLKFELVKKEFPDAIGTVVGGLSFTDQVRSHAEAVGLKLTLYRDLTAQILDGPRYAQALIREIEQNDRYVPNLFVEPIVASDSTSEGQNAFTFVDQWLGDSRWNQLTLLGDVGTGKSFFCRMLALQLATDYLANPINRPLPMLVDLRNADREFSLEGIILTHFAQHGLSRATFDVFDFLLGEGRIILILDGFDEMASRVTPIITARNFHELARSVKLNAKVLLTCRTHYFKSRTEEEEIVLGAATPQTHEVARDLYWDLISRNGFRIAYLRPFSMSQVETYIRKACPESANTVLEKIEKTYNLSELSQRPLLLDMIVKSFDRLKAGEINSGQLYKIYTDAWIHRDIWRNLISPADKLKFLTALARSLWDQDSTTIEYQKLQEYVGAELSNLIDSPQKLIELDGEIRTATFLVRDDRGHYGFAHASYAEYFLARHLATQLNAGNIDCLAIRRLSNETIDFLACLLEKTRLDVALTKTLQQEYRALLSENSLLILYRLRRNLLIEEQGRGTDNTNLQVEMPADAQLQGAKLAQVTLEGAVLVRAALTRADLRQCIASGADLSHSCLKGALLSKSDFHDARLREVDAADATLSEINLQGADVHGCDFTRADLSSSILTAKNLQEAVLQDAKLEGVVVLPGLERLVGISTKISTELEWDKERALSHAFKFVRLYAKRQGAPSHAEDIASDVVVYLLSHPAELAALGGLGSNFDDFLRTVAWRMLSNLRPDGEMPEWPPVPGRLKIEEEEDIAPDEQMDETDVLDQIAESMVAPEYIDRQLPSGLLDSLYGRLRKHLSEDALRILLKRYVDEKSVKEIAKEERISQVQVARRLNKARELARNALLEE